MQHFVTYLLAFWLAVGVALSPLTDPIPAAQAQPPDDQLGESLGFVILFPQLRTLPPPAWFQPGVRVSYDVISANFQGGGAGGGVAQYDVLGLNAGWAVVSAQSFIDNGAGALIPTGPAPKVGLPAVGEIWINPQVLTNAEAVANQNLSVTRINKTYLGQVRQVVRFESITQGQSGIARTVWEFNSASGLLLFYSQSLDGVTASQLLVRNFRTLNMVHMGTRAPNWVRPGAQLDFTGTQSQQIANAGNFVMPFAISNQIAGATPTWSIQGQNLFLNNSFSGSASTATGIGQVFGGLWLPSDALARIPGNTTIIDNDPDTGAQLRIGRADNGEIFLREINQAYNTILFYDPNLGALNGILQSITMLTSITNIDVRRTGGSNLPQLNTLPPLASDPDPTGPEDNLQPDLSQSQTFTIDLPTTTLRLETPANFVAQPADLTVNIVLGPPPPPPDQTPVGDAFILNVSTRADGDPLLAFDKPVTLRITLPTLASASAHTPALYHRTAEGWQPLTSTYDPDDGTVTASHDRAGLYGVFQADRDNDIPGRIFLPTLRR
ncbi:MAG: hypothetical protein WDZ49_02485 [Litorilinea sp.]